MDAEEIDEACQAPDDWLQQQDQLQETAPNFTAQHKYIRMFATDSGAEGCDQYVYIAPNGLCVVGLAPSHYLIKQLRAEHAAPAEILVPPADMQGIESANEEPIQTTNQLQQENQPASAHGVKRPASENQPQGEDGRECTAIDETDSREQAGTQNQQQAGDAPQTSVVEEQQQQSPIKQPDTKKPATAAAVAGVSISFDIGNRTAAIRHSGKKRNQGSFLEPNSVLCVITSAGKSLAVRPVSPGKLLEVNQRLTQQPQLLYTRPCREGYLGILYPSENQLNKLKASLMSCEDYLKLRGMTEEDLS